MTDNKIINVQDIWLDVDAVANLKGVTKRAVRLSIRQGKYISKTNNIRGGKSYRILLSSLEPEIQNKYLNEYYNSLVITETSEPFAVIDNNRELKQEKIITEKQKQIALARLDIINVWQDFRKNQKNKSDGNKKFLELYNTGEFYKDIYSVLGKVKIGSIYRWNQLLGGTDDWSLLVSDYKYKSSGEYRTSLTQDEINIFMKLLLSPNQFSVGKAISLTKHILHKRGLEILPKEITFRRYAENFKKYNYDKWILAREGEKALKDKVEPFIVRDASILEVGQILVADGHRLNFQVINPFNGKPCRAVLVGFLDWRSGALVGYEIMLEENTQCIASALRNSILNLGRIPDIVYQDNGGAFKARFFQGGKNFEELKNLLYITQAAK